MFFPWMLFCAVATLVGRLDAQTVSEAATAPRQSTVDASPQAPSREKHTRVPRSRNISSHAIRSSATTTTTMRGHVPTQSSNHPTSQDAAGDQVPPTLDVFSTMATDDCRCQFHGCIVPTVIPPRSEKSLSRRKHVSYSGGEQERRPPKNYRDHQYTTTRQKASRTSSSSSSHSQYYQGSGGDFSYYDHHQQPQRKSTKHQHKLQPRNCQSCDGTCAFRCSDNCPFVPSMIYMQSSSMNEIHNQE